MIKNQGQIAHTISYFKIGSSPNFFSGSSTLSYSAHIFCEINELT